VSEGRREEKKMVNWVRPVVIFLGIFTLLAIILTSVALSQDPNINGTNNANEGKGPTGPRGANGKNGKNGINGENAVYQSQFQVVSLFNPQQNVPPYATPLPAPVGFPLLTFLNFVSFPPSMNVPGMIPNQNDNRGIDLLCTTPGVYIINIRFSIVAPIAYFQAFMYNVANQTWTTLMPLSIPQLNAPGTIVFGTQSITATVVSQSRIRFIYARGGQAMVAANVEVTTTKVDDLPFPEAIFIP
jgi:hypothetical protein